MDIHEFFMVHAEVLFMWEMDGKLLIENKKRQLALRFLFGKIEKVGLTIFPFASHGDFFSMVTRKNKLVEASRYIYDLFNFIVI